MIRIRRAAPRTENGGDAITRVLRAEQDAERAVAEARTAADELLARARQRALEISARADRRVTSLNVRCAETTARRIAELRDTEREQEALSQRRLSEAELDGAAGAVARWLLEGDEP